MKVKTTNILLVSAALLALGCDSAEHPTASDSITRYKPADVVGRVDGRPIGAVEARLAADRVGDDPVDVAAALADRELLVSRALQDGKRVEFTRKQAMVRAFLEDEIEEKTTLTEEEREVSDGTLARARAELVGPCGYEAQWLHVRPSDGDSAAQKAVRKAITTGFARSVVRGLQLDETLQVSELDLDSFAGPFDLELRPDVKLSSPLCVAGLASEGWVSNDTVARGLIQLGPGKPFSIGFGDAQFVVYSSAFIEGETPTDNEIQEEALRIARIQKQANALGRLRAKLRESAQFTIYPEALESPGGAE